MSPKPSLHRVIARIDATARPWNRGMHPANELRNGLLLNIKKEPDKTGAFKLTQ